MTNYDRGPTGTTSRGWGGTWIIILIVVLIIIGIGWGWGGWNGRGTATNTHANPAAAGNTAPGGKTGTSSP